MKHGDIIVLKKFVSKTRLKGFREERLAVVLEVSQKDIDQGTDVIKPGLYGFYGLWYGKDPLDHKCYGKLVEARGRVVGQVKRESQAALFK